MVDRGSLLPGFDEARLEKLQEMQQSGMVVYPYRFGKEATVAQVLLRGETAGHERSEEQVKTAGRVMTVRNHGKTVFADLQDSTGRIQLYLRKNDLGDEQFSYITQFLDRGDLIGVEGKLFRTKVGEITIWAEKVTPLAPCLTSLPEKFHGLRDTEKRYRQRYVDLIVNPDSQRSFRTRSRIISLLRRYLDDREFLEFETPILQPLYGGANARPFTTHHHFLNQTLYLRIAPELYLKRLVVGGFDKVYEIARNFRNEDIDARHNPEFTMVEIYHAYQDVSDMMALTESILSSLATEVCGSPDIPYGDTTLDFHIPFRRLSMEDAVREYTGIDCSSTPFEELHAIARDRKIEGCEDATSPRELLILFFEELVEDQLVQPTFIHDFPVENSPLAKRHRSKAGFTERFELFIKGMEIANGFSELNDPLDQLGRLEAQDEKRRAGDLEAQMIDYDFINALATGLPPTGGVGIGIDRLVMLLTSQTSIKEVILFPQMKIAKENTEEGEEEEGPLT